MAYAPCTMPTAINANGQRGTKAFSAAWANCARSQIAGAAPNRAAAASDADSSHAFIFRPSLGTSGGGNSLAAAASAAAIATAIEQFAACLRVGGRLFVQILNFTPMRKRVPCVQGPRTTDVEGLEYVSVRQFHFVGQEAQVTNITIWKEGEWKQLAHAGRLYPIEREELLSLCAKANLRVDALWGSYARESFDLPNSVDLIVVATRQ